MKRETDGPLVSVVMPAYNARRTIAESIESVRAQTYGRWELIVVDDGSSDATGAFVRERFDDPRITVAEQANAGVAAARNTGIAKAKGDLVAFLDSDDLWLPRKLEAQVAVFLRDPALGLCWTARKVLRDRPEDAVTVEEEIPPGEIDAALLRGNFIALVTVMVRREALETAGLFDTGLFGTEDWDLWIRIGRRYATAYLAQPLALYRDHEGGISKNLRRHLAEKAKVIDKHVSSAADVPVSLRREILWKQALQEGAFALECGECAGAAKRFFRALRLGPSRRGTYAFLVRIVRECFRLPARRRGT